jgi:hypothetical protein
VTQTTAVRWGAATAPTAASVGSAWLMSARSQSAAMTAIVRYVCKSILGYDNYNNLMIHTPLLTVAKLISIKFKDTISGFGPGRALIKKKINFPHI